MSAIADNPHAVPLHGDAPTRGRVIPPPPPPQRPFKVVRAGWVVLAQFETGRIAAVVTSNPDDWRDEVVRLQEAAFGRFTAFRFATVDMARDAIDALAREIRARFGTERFCADQQLVKTFIADWPIVLDTFMRQNGLECPA